MDEDEYNIGIPSDVLGAGASTDAPTPEDPGFMDLFGDFLFGGGAQGLAGLGLLTGAYNRLGGIGERGLGLGQNLATQQMQQAAFRPYTITTPTGAMFTAGPSRPMTPEPMTPGAPNDGIFIDDGPGFTFDPMFADIRQGAVIDDTTGFTSEPLPQRPDGPSLRDFFNQFNGTAAPTLQPQGQQFGMQLSPMEQAFQQRMFGDAGTFFGQGIVDPSVREEQIYGQIETALDPQQRAQRLGLEERLAAQGRLGVKTSQFGGTPEQLAMEKAQAQQLAQARLSAAQQARQEQMQQAQLGQQYLGASYIPQAQMLSALAPGQTAAAQAQQAQLYGTGLFGEATASGIDALLGAGLGQANLMGAAGTGLLSGLFASPESAGGTEDNRSGFFRNIYDYITGG